MVIDALLNELSSKLDNIQKSKNNLLYLFEEKNDKFNRTYVLHNIVESKQVEFSFFDLAKKIGSIYTESIEDFEKTFVKTSIQLYGLPFEIYIESKLNEKIYEITKKKRLYSRFIYKIKNDLYLSFYNSYALLNLKDIDFSFIENNTVAIEDLPIINNKIKTYAIDLSQKYFLMGIENNEEFDFQENGKFLCHFKNKNYYLISNLENVKNILGI